MAETNRTDQKPPLFRQEALRHQTQSIDGEVLLALTFPTRVLMALAVGIVVAAVVFVSIGSYARMETVTGWVVPQEGLIRLSARQGGTISAINVSEGDAVDATDVVATLQLSSETEGGNAAIALARQIEIQAQAEWAEAEATEAKLIAERTGINTQRAAISRELEATSGRVSALDERADLMRAHVERILEIADRGFASKKSIDDARMAELAARQDAAEARAIMLGLQRQLEDLNSRLSTIPLDINAVSAQARASQAALAQRETEVAMQHVYHVPATVSGHVVALPVSRGQTVPAGAAIAVINPAGSKLDVELYVPSRSAGFIRRGQEVRLMYEAFPYQKFGTSRGVVRDVSRTVLAPNEVTIPGLQVQEPVFRVKVDLERDSVDAYGQTIPLQPGMLLSANIVIDRRTLLEWILDPIFAVGRLG